MKSKELVSENIKRLRKLRGVSQEKMASDVGLNPVTIRYYEYGERFPKPEVLDLLADYFKVSLTEFFKSEDEALITSSDSSIDLISQIASLGPVEIEILKSTLQALTKPIPVSLKKNKEG